MKYYQAWAPGYSTIKDSYDLFVWTRTTYEWSLECEAKGFTREKAAEIYSIKFVENSLIQDVHTICVAIWATLPPVLFISGCIAFCFPQGILIFLVIKFLVMAICLPMLFFRVTSARRFVDSDMEVLKIFD